MPRHLLTLVVWLALNVSTACALAQPATWQAGVATQVITPELPLWMAGYAARDRPAEGKLHDLHAKALALQDPTGRQAVLLTMDLCGIPRDVATAVCQQIEERHGLSRAAVLLSVSHTHSGPIVAENLRPAHQIDAAQHELVRRYAESLKEQLVAVAGQALEDLAPADLAWGNGYVTFAVNRRNNREADVPARRAEGRLVGPVDHDVPVLSVRTKEGTLRAVLFGYACHATTLAGYEWSGDYPGFAQIALEQAHPGAVALFFAGCGADQNPVPRRAVALAEQYGHELAAGVAAVLAAPMTAVEGDLAVAYREVPLPFAELPTRETLEATAAGSNPFEATRAKMLLAELDRTGSLRRAYPYPLQTWRLGGLTLVALGGEVVVDYSLRLKRELGRDSTWIAAYTNDVMAYIPSERVLAEGGYEGGGAMVYYGLPSPWAPGVEDAILAAVHEQVETLRGTPTGQTP